MLNYLALSLLMLNYLTHYEVDCVWAFQGKCPQNVTAVGDFQMDRFLGKWYTYAMYPELKGRKHKCMSTEFIKNPDNSYEAKVVELNPSSDTVEVRTAKIARIRPTAGKFDVLVKNHTAFPEGIETYVLDTDYENYAIRYLCIESNEVFNFQWVAIQTRNRLPDSQHVSDVQKLAKASGITLSKLVRVPQDACPKDT